ncbi:MAG: hypothetical protein NC543_14810 [bacterium]|nr:hypothetical protein [bacterium]MCM1376555.1 hypothetical protein [Muribaculum sp.]
MKRATKITAVLLAAVLLAGAGADTVYARHGHCGAGACDSGYAACYQDGVCLQDGSCDVDGVCQNGGSCVGHVNREKCHGSYGRHNRGHHSERSHRSGCHH